MAMRTTVVAVVLLSALVVAHGDDHVEMSDMATTNATKPYNSGLDVPSYAGLPTHSGTMLAHIASMVLAWLFVLPVGVIFSVARSKFALPVQFLFLALNSIGVALGTVYNFNTPELYENNAHHSIGWVATLVSTVQVIMGVLFFAARRPKMEELSPTERVAFLPAVLRDLNSSSDRHLSEHRWSDDSGRSTVVGSPRDDSHDMSSSDPLREQYQKLERQTDEDEGFAIISRSNLSRFWPRNFLRRRFVGHIAIRGSGKLMKLMEIMYEVIDRTVLILDFMALASGVVTYTGIFRGDEVFSGLAHFVKGGIFFWYGLLTLGRWMGCFADFGWAWNIEPTRSEVGKWSAAIPTAEFIESFVIFLYGVMNVFMEHLGGSGNAWSAQDLEHISISVMFFGGGLLGMLVESKTIRKWLNTSVDMMPARIEFTPTEAQEIRSMPKQYQSPMNPIPALVILLLGIMMSSHHQDSMVSTMVHKQWGTLLCGFSLARGFTYIINYVSPFTSIYPSRPPTELISSFCLISGGLIFMLSARNCVQLMEKYNLMAMFLFTVVVGFTAFLMAWEMLVLSLKGWVVRREHKRLRH